MMDEEIIKIKEIATSMKARGLRLLENSEYIHEHQKIILCEYVVSLSNALKLLRAYNSGKQSNYYIMLIIKQFMEHSLLIEKELREQSISLDVH